MRYIPCPNEGCTHLMDPRARECKHCAANRRNGGGVMFTPARMRILHALAVVYMRDGRVTTRSLCEHTGLSISTVHEHLVRLRKRGLVEGEAGGTLRPGPVS